MNTHDQSPLDPRKLKSLVRLALFHGSKNSKLRRQEINDLVFSTDPSISRRPADFSRYLSKSNQVLRSEFGLELVELAQKNDKSKDKNYSLRNTIPVAIRNTVKDFLPDPALTGLIGMVLAFIYVSGSVIRDDQLQLLLARLGIQSDPTPAAPAISSNPTSLSYMQLLTHLTKLGYVVREQSATMSTSSEVHYFNTKWGPRAFAELSHLNLREAIAAIYGYAPASPEYDALMSQLDIASTL